MSLRTAGFVLALATVTCGARARTVARPRAPSGASLASAALAQLDRMESQGPELPAEARSEAFRTARTGLQLAGSGAIPALASRLRERQPGGKGAVIAWALGVVADMPGVERSAPGDRRAVAALRAALDAPDWPCRLAAASALGLLGERAASERIVALHETGDRPEASDAPLLLALAGTGGDAADALLDEELEHGGDQAWASATMGLQLRRGTRAWPSLVRALGSADPSVRATASTLLLVLAEPGSACEIAESYGREPEPSIRRVLLQALAATDAPGARAFLAHASSVEADPDLRADARVLATERLDARASLGGPRPGPLDVRAALAALAEGTAFPRALRDVEDGATGVDLPIVERTLRRLPLREDPGWLDDHARLAQLRARLLCSGDPDCEPHPTMVIRRRTPR